MPRPSRSLEKEFTDALIASNEEAAKLGCYSVEFEAMIKVHGGVQTATRLVGTSNIQSGMRRLCTVGRPDLTTEATMLRPEFCPLFKPQQLEAARWRLESLKGARR
jgi:hypothetical protein